MSYYLSMKSVRIFRVTTFNGSGDSVTDRNLPELALVRIQSLGVTVPWNGCDNVHYPADSGEK